MHIVRRGFFRPRARFTDIAQFARPDRNQQQQGFAGIGQF
jgi:hypothetical protein